MLLVFKSDASVQRKVQIKDNTVDPARSSFSCVTKFVYDKHTLERWSANQIASVNCSGRFQRTKCKEEVSRYNEELNKDYNA